MIGRPHGAWRAGLALAALIGLGSTGIATADEQGMIPGGGQRALGGDRVDETKPQLGTGNRGSAARGNLDRSLDPAVIEKDPMGPGVVIGDVLKIDGSTYVVRDKDGNELSLRTDAQTRIDGLIRIGAKVIAEVDAHGHVARVAPSR